MATWNSRGLRGSGLEEFINITNDKYKEEGLALVQKIPTSIIPLKMNYSKTEEDDMDYGAEELLLEMDGEMDNMHHRITSAYFEKKSTVDYIGVVQGVPICFDAKECTKSSFPLQNVHEHQMEFMKKFEEQDGISFFIIYFSEDDVYYYMPYRDMRVFWERAKNGGRKSIMRSEFEEWYEIPVESQVYVRYLENLAVDLESRDE